MRTYAIGELNDVCDVYPRAQEANYLVWLSEFTIIWWLFAPGLVRFVSTVGLVF